LSAVSTGAPAPEGKGFGQHLNLGCQEIPHALPQFQGQPRPRLGERTRRWKLALQIRKGSHGIVPEQLGAGLEGFLWPNGRQDHVQHRDNRGQHTLSVCMPEVPASLFNGRIGQNLSDRIKRDLLKLERNI
jgi:hypothetical protein